MSPSRIVEPDNLERSWWRAERVLTASLISRHRERYRCVIGVVDIELEPTFLVFMIQRSVGVLIGVSDSFFVLIP